MTRKVSQIMKDHSLYYDRVYDLYDYMTHRRGGRWFLLPTWSLDLVCIALGIAAAWRPRWWLIFIAAYFYGESMKRRGIREGFALGYSAGDNHDADERVPALHTK